MREDGTFLWLVKIILSWKYRLSFFVEYEQHVGDKRTHPPEDYAEEGDVISSKKSGRFRWGVSSLTILHKAYEKCNNPSRLERYESAPYFTTTHVF